ncbi:hypothetical protein BV501_06805 [Erwinia sp. OAMSP11]|nr:hypothetical protein BVG91_13800 [Serratia marcescens]EDI8177516.1 hypothetical protein [Salmonella enterica]PIJ50893.1 hypothetical protein BV501_06805 [Erwinia sp. OAMSP11]
MIFPLIFKLLFEKIFISVLTHGYALTLTFLFYSSPVCQIKRKVLDHCLISFPHDDEFLNIVFPFRHIAFALKRTGKLYPW